MYCISISYKNADIDIRKRFAFPEDIQKAFSEKLIHCSNACESVVLCTCNRTEVYFCGNKKSVYDVRKLLSEYSGIPEPEFIRCIRFFSGKNALNHLFRVACGIESMVIGEDEILGQLKKAYKLAYENHTVSHTLNIIFQSAVTCAKKIKTDTELSKTSVSTATLASNEASKFCENVKVLIIGATGKIGSSVFKNLFSHKNVSIKVTQRNSRNNFLNLKAETVDYNERYKYIKESDCIISATSSPHYTITLDRMTDFIDDGKKRLFIDLAVPPDIDESIAEYKNVSLFGIDYFEKLAEINNNLKTDSIERSEQIISEEIKNLENRLAMHQFMPELERVKKNFSGQSLEKILYKMKSELNSESFSDVLDFLKNYKGD